MNCQLNLVIFALLLFPIVKDALIHQIALNANKIFTYQTQNKFV